MRGPIAACLSPLAWGDLWTSRHELCSELAERGWQVVFVDPPVNRVRKHAGRVRPGSPVPPPGVQVAVPPAYLPYGFAARPAPRLARRLIAGNASRYAEFVASRVEQLHPGRPVDLLVNSFMPVLGHGVQARLHPRVTVYHRSDELTQFPSWRPYFSELEARVAGEADAVVCVSEQVKAGISDSRPDAVVIPNGVDTRPYRDGVVLDQRVAALPRPVSVMVGVFDGRIDQSLLDAAARVSTLVMAGRIEGVTVPEGALWLGHVEHSEIPGILCAADVGLVCYRAGWAGDVLKIYEYLAAGLPVVTSHLPAPGDVRSAVTVAQAPDEFADAVKVASDGRSAAADAARRALADRNSWSRRVDALLEVAGFSERRATR